MPAWRKSVVLLIASACLAAAADPLLLNRVSPQTKVLAGADVSRFTASLFGRSLLSQLQTSEPQFAALTKMVGFDPFRDLQEIVVASPGDAKDNRGLLLMRGIFDPSRIQDLAKQSSAMVESYKGVPVMHDKQKTDPWFAFVDSTTAALGDAQSVREMIDRGTAGSGPDPRLVSRANETAARYDFWIVSMVPATNLSGNVSNPQLNGIMQGDIVRNVVETAGGIKFGPDIVIGGQAVTRSDKDAAALADVFKFFIGIVQMSAQKNPAAASSMAFLQRMSLKTEGNVFSVSLTIPEAELQKLIRQGTAVAREQAGATSRPAPAVPNRTAPADGGIVIQSSPKDMGTIVIK